ncbi:MAG: serine/threonine-protein kinase PknK [Sandaracinaceae bacterium]
MLPTIPTMVGPYRIERVLGEGGMGVVYAGVGPDGERAAVKLMRLEAIQRSPTAAVRFAQEAQMRFTHPNVVRVLDAGQDPISHLPYIAFEHLDGVPVDERMESGSLSVSSAVAIVEAAAEGVGAAHAVGVVHRDVKPSNLFLCQDGTTKVLDFGIARVVSRDTRLTREGGTVGTVAYFSPEQARGEAGVDGRSDVWSLGVMLYEMLSGRHPFDRGDILPTMLAILAERASPLRLVAPHIAPNLAAVVDRCLQPSPADRFPHGRALAEALRATAPTKEPDVRVDAATEVVPTVNASITPGEARLVAVLMATGIVDDGLAKRVEDRAGVFLPLPSGQGIGVFGAEAWDGDEIESAASAALAGRSSATSISIAAGRATYSGHTGISGTVLDEARRGCEAGLEGVALSGEVARALGPTHEVVRHAEGLFELLRRHATTTGDIAASLTPPPGALLGREAELSQLRRSIEASFYEQHATVVLATGPAGIGKTRLTQAFVRLLEDMLPEPPLILSSRCERQVTRPVLPEGLMSSYAHERGLPPVNLEEPLEAQRRAVTVLAEDVMSPALAAEHAPFLGVLLGVPMEANEALSAARKDAQLMADRLRIAMMDWLRGVMDQGPFVMVLEDLHRSDEVTLSVLEDVLTELDAEAMVLCTARPDFETRFPDTVRSIDLRLELRGLLRAEVAELAGAIGGRPLDAARVEQLTAHTGGNPFFVEQIMLTLAVQGDPDDTLPLPQTIEAAIQGRLDRLAIEDKDLCKRAAVLGRPFSPAELALLFPHAALADLDRRLGALTRNGTFLARGRGRDRREYAFRSPLVQEVAYRMVADVRRRELHLEVARGLGDDDAAALEAAAHFEASGRLPRAAERYATGAVFATTQGQAREAIDAGEKALSLGPPDTLLFPLHRALAEAYDALGQLPEQEAHLETACMLSGSDADRAGAESALAVWLQRSGRPKEAMAMATEAVHSAHGAGDTSASAMALGRRAFVQIYAGDLGAAEVDLAEAERIAEQCELAVRAYAAAWRAQLATARGDLGARRAAYARAAELHRQVGDLRRAAGAELNLADVLNRFGAYAAAVEALKVGIRNCERSGRRISEGYARANLGYALTALGRPSEANTELARALELANASEDRRLANAARLYKTRILVTERPLIAAVEAEAIADEAEGAVSTLARSTAARAYLAGGDVERALSLSKRALAEAMATGGLEEDEAEVYVARIAALQAAGRVEEATRIRQEGQRRLLESAALIREEEWRQRFLSEVKAHRVLLAGALER